MKKKIYLIILIVLIIMIIPIPIRLKDGGSISYNAVLYSVTKYHSINPASIKGYDDGWKIKIFGLTIYDKKDISVFNEHVISVKSKDKIIEANTSGFCYKSGVCVDKIDFKDFKYDVISINYGDKLYIDNLDGTIKSIELFDYSYSDFKNTLVEFTDEYIVTPDVSGTYIFIINSTYEEKDIKYYFMADISKI